MKKRRVLVTGASGFVGEAVIFRLLLDGNFTPIAAMRANTRLNGLCPVVKFDLCRPESMPILSSVDVVIHCAARVHVMNETAIDSLSAFRQANVEGTVWLARQAATCGVKRFVFISSIKVNGESTGRGAFFRADDEPAPLDPYGISKCEAEVALRRVGAETGMEVVVIRPPLVYGPGVKANFLVMMRWLDRGLPLPFGMLDNRRSLVSLGNLADLIVTCIEHPAAANQTFLVSDGEDLSTSQLLLHMARAMGKLAILLPVPTVFLKLLGSAFGKSSAIDRLCGSLQVDIGPTQKILDWQPPLSAEKAFRQTAEYYLEKYKK